MPDKEIPSFSVVIRHKSSNKTRSDFAEKMHHGLLMHKSPVLAVLKKGDIYFDMLTVFKSEAKEIAAIISEVYHQIKTKE